MPPSRASRRPTASAGARPGNGEDPEVPVRAALAAGDHRKAIVELMKLYGADVFAFCERFLKHRAPADDVHQKTFIQAYESLGSFEGKSRLRTWLLGIAYNRCLDEIKVIIREVSRRADEDPDDRPAEKVASADARLHSARRAVALTGCIDELAPRIRAAVLMRYQEELSYEEMAEAMGQRAGTLRVRVARAMAALRQCLDRKGFAA